MLTSIKMAQHFSLPTSSGLNCPKRWRVKNQIVVKFGQKIACQMTTNFRKIGKQLEKSKEFKSRLERNIAKGTTDPGVDSFDQ